MSKRLAVIVGMGLWCSGILSPALVQGAEPAAGAQSFADALMAAGWEVEVLADGTFQLTPAAKTPSPAEAAEPQGSAVPESRPTVEPAERPGWSVLSNFGWRVENRPDGSTLLFPPPAASSREPQAPPEPQAKEPPAVQAELAHDLDALLAERGWRVQRDVDGSLRLHPLLAAREVPVGLEPSAGSIPAAVRDAKISLPVDSWEKARATALSWLESVGDPALQLGKIRRIHRLYLVSIIGAEPPHRLLHQIAVGVDDGRVVVLN